CRWGGGGLFQSWADITIGSFLDYTARSCISNWNEVRNRYLKHAHLSEREFRQVLKMYCADVGALTASKLTGLNKNTTHRLYGLLREQLLHRATPLAARFLLGPCRRSACFLDDADDVRGLVRWDQGVNSADAPVGVFLPSRFWFSDVSPFTGLETNVLAPTKRKSIQFLAFCC